MKLSEKQRIFSRNFTTLLVWIHSHPGWGVTFAEAYRTEDQARINANKGVGIINSLHRKRLAIDLNFFINGAYQTSTKAYTPIGKFWESLHPNNRWGGTFKDKRGRPKPDGNHVQMYAFPPKKPFKMQP